MIIVTDDFFGKETFKAIQEYCTADFQILDIGEKKFSVLQTPDALLPLLQINGYDLTLTFIRNAYKDFDNDLRIHCDYYINNSKTDLASVLYINNPDGVIQNGTAFYNHETYGDKAPDDLSKEQFDKLIKEDSNDIQKWEMTDYIASKPNRRLLYDANYFHAKFPSVIEEGVRIVLVCFYSEIKES